MIDQIYQCQIPGQELGIWQVQCHLRIFQPHPGIQTVLINNMGFEIGWFIPYLVEQLVDQVVQEFHLDPAKLVWIEHYTPGFEASTGADFSQVTFDWQDGHPTHPQWQAIASETVQVLINQELQRVSA